MLIPLPAVAFGLLGIAIWALAFWWGEVPPFLDQRNRHLLRVGAGAACFAIAFALWVVKAAH